MYLTVRGFFLERSEQGFQLNGHLAKEAGLKEPMIGVAI